MRKTLEKDNYLSINIIKLPGKEDRSKSLSTRDIFINKKNVPNKITKVESINIKKSKEHKTDKEIEEEINRRVKITIIEKEKMEREKKKKEEEKEMNIRKERERKEKERKEKLEKERKEREEKIKKQREERYLKQKEERNKREELIRLEREKQRKLREEQMKIEKEKKEKEKNISEFNHKEIEQTTVTKRINTRNVTKYTRTSNINNIDDSNKTNIRTVKLNEEKKINMSDYILKKDCQKNLEEMKSKLEKEYQRKIEFEKNKIIVEKKRYEEKIQIINKKEIEIKNQLDKEIKKNLQKELEKQEKMIKQKELDEKDKKLKQMKINKVVQYNLISKKNIVNNNNINDNKNIIKNKEKDKQKAIKILKKFILSKGNYLIKLKKYFVDWRVKSKNLGIVEKAKLIQKYCRGIIKKSILKRVKQNWIKLSKKIFYKKRIKILKLLPNLNKKKRKIYELIRITKLNKIFSRRRFIHYIILLWYIYSRNTHQKKSSLKFLYENLLRTYMTLANDIFGNNQIENPSVQDAMYEVLISNKFISLHQDDVPLAKKHYEEMRKKKLLERKNRINSYKYEYEQKSVKNIYFSKTEENEQSFDDKKNEELLNKYRQYKSMNRDLIIQRKNRYINSVDKDNNDKRQNQIKNIYNKTEINKVYSKPVEIKNYEIKEQKIIPRNNNLVNAKTYQKEISPQNNNKIISSHSYKKTEINKFSKENNKSNEKNVPSKNTNFVTSYYTNKNEDKNKYINKERKAIYEKKEKK